MSGNKSKLQLNQLVYRHLKENGFHAAAEELQRHNPQAEADISLSLFDIYKSWLKASKKKKLQKSARCSSPEGKEKTPNKGKVSTPKKAADKPVNDPALSEKSNSQKRKKDGEKSSKSVVKAKKLKLDAANDASAGGRDSDSDSSLDVEKWKKLVFQMSETDLAKMEIINALDPSAPEPKKKRVRKPRAKPPLKVAANVHDNNGVAEKNSNDKEEAVSSKSKPRKSGPEDTAHVSSSESPNQKINISSKEKTAAATLPPEKQTLFKMYMSLLTSRKEKTNHDPAPEPKKKKKKKKESVTHEDDTARDAEKTVEKVIKEKKTKSAKTETENNEVEKNANFCTEPAVQEKKAKKKKKKEKTRSEDSSAETAENTEVRKKKKLVDGEKNSELNSAEKINTDQTVTNPDKTGNEERLEEKVKQKKVKRKKEKVVCEDILEVQTVEAQENREQRIEDEENPELIVKKKKAKKKKKESADVENNPEVQALKAKKKNPDEDISEQMDEEKSKKKHKAGHEEATSKHTHKDNKSTPERANCATKQEHVEHLSVDTDLLEGSNQETTPPKKKKKKKSKLKSEEVPEEAGVSLQDVTTTQTPPADSHRKKKKSTPES